MSTPIPSLQQLIVFVFSLFLISCNLIEEESKQQMLPNIIYILADDLGYGDLQSFNPEGKIPTPHLDELAKAGMIFTDAHTSSSVCTPTRYGILTGRYNWRSTLKKGVLWSKSPALILPERMTVASLLQSAGYHTAFIGKWHLGWDWVMDSLENIDFSQPIGNAPNDVGFSYAYGHMASLDIPPYVYVEDRLATAMPKDSTENKDYQGFWRNGLTAPDFVHEQVTPNFFTRANQYIQQQSKTKAPFFLYLPLPSPHTPILPTREWQGKSGLNPYGDFVMMLDHHVGALVATVKAAGIEDNTMIIFTSDNGCSPRAKFDELVKKKHDPSYHFRGHKADIYEGGHRVPFIVKWPNMVEGGRQSNATICTTDFLATCAEITQQKIPENAGEDSFSMMPLLTNKGTYQRQSTVHHSIHGDFAIRKNEWKLVLGPGSCGWSFPRPNFKYIDTFPAYQLFDLASDIQEQNNLIDEYPAIASSLRNLLIQQIEAGRSTPGAPQTNDGPYPWKQLAWMKDSKW